MGHRVDSRSIGFTKARLGGVWFSGVLLPCAKGSCGSFEFTWFHSGAPRGRLI